MTFAPVKVFPAGCINSCAYRPPTFSFVQMISRIGDGERAVADQAEEEAARTAIRIKIRIRQAEVRHRPTEREGRAGTMDEAASGRGGGSPTATVKKAVMRAVAAIPGKAAGENATRMCVYVRERDLF